MTSVSTEQPDKIIHQPIRLKIMAALNILPDQKCDKSFIEFTRLKTISGASDGNLGAQITKLEEAKYVEIEKSFVGKKPRTRIRITSAGRSAFSAYKIFLKSIIDEEM